MTGPELIILAGPNGVGKTTFAQRNLRPFIEQGAFLNADDMARDTNPSDVEAVAMEAGRRMLGRRKDFLERRQSFWSETTLATRTLCALSFRRPQRVIEPGSSFSSRRCHTSTNCA